jgi:hypothetical protein
MIGIGRRLALYGMLAMAMAVAGCGDDDETTEPTNIAGTYTLRTIDGAALPFTLFTAAQNDGTKREVTGGTVTLEADGTYSDVFEFRDTDALGEVTEYTDPNTGTYVRTGNTLAFTAFNEVPQQPATIRNGALIYEIETDVHPNPLEFRLTK